MNTLSIDDILRGTEPGRMQSVGHMQIIPLVGEDDDRYAPPELEVKTTAYGTVELRNDSERPTIVPPGAGWVVKQAAQDHAIGGGLLLAAKAMAKITTARCIQSSQGGYISKARHPMLVIPAPLRSQALAIRRQAGYDKLWGPISAFNESVGAKGGSHLEYFLRHFKAQLDQFVAEFELVPNQVGAIVLVGGCLVGVERAPSSGFWRTLWEPLIRVCYGALAIARAQLDDAPPPTRVALEGGATSIRELRAALASAQARERTIRDVILAELGALELKAASRADQVLGEATLVTLASSQLAGQLVRAGDQIAFASLCAAELGRRPIDAAKAGATWLERLRTWLFG